jgi:adenine-specific DNA-methyltransferase
MNALYRNLDNDPRGVWKSENSTAQAGHGTKSQFYVLTAPNGKQHALPNGRCWLYTEPVLQQMIADNRIWFGSDGNNVPAVKRFLSEVKQGTACQTIWKYVDVGHNQEAKKEVNDLFPESSVFDTPKPSRLIKRILQLAADKNDIILDFFSGSATTAHAVMQLNAEDGGKRKFIMVQLPETCDEKSEACKAGYLTISEIGKERIRRAGQKIRDTLAPTVGAIPCGCPLFEATTILTQGTQGQPQGIVPTDIGFRVLKIDSSNMKDFYYTPDSLQQAHLFDQIDNIREDRTPEDLLFQVLLDWGVDLTLPITQEIIADKTVFFVNNNALAACFDIDINEAFVKQLGKRQPLRVVFRDAGFSSDSVKINTEQIFKLMSPNTEIKTI